MTVENKPTSELKIIPKITGDRDDIVYLFFPEKTKVHPILKCKQIATYYEKKQKNTDYRGIHNVPIKMLADTKSFRDPKPKEQVFVDRAIQNYYLYKDALESAKK